MVGQTRGTDEFATGNPQLLVSDGSFVGASHGAFPAHDSWGIGRIEQPRELQGNFQVATGINVDV
jgi:hypothetical protein